MVPRARYLAAQIEKDLARKMAFVGGARQVGKTTLALQVLGDLPGYLNWDVPEDRERILTGKLPPSPLLVLDEIHKYRSWRNYLKGLYDSQVQSRRKRRILVTGSARLDFYRFGGDSLQGRYHYLRLHPFSVAELGIRTRREFARLLEIGGFPEPFLQGSAVEARRWSREYRTRLIRDDLASLERVQDLGNIELLMLRLPELVGSPLSINALREDLQVSHKTLSKWVDMLERLYAVFRLPPLGAPRLRAVKKERKHYHADWTLVPDRALRFENLVASHLLKWVHFEEDSKGRDLELRYRLRGNGGTGSEAAPRVQVGRRAGRQEPHLSQAPLPGLRGLPVVRHGQEGLRNARGHPGVSRARASARAGLAALETLGRARTPPANLSSSHPLTVAGFPPSPPSSRHRSAASSCGPGPRTNRAGRGRSDNPSARVTRHPTTPAGCRRGYPDARAPPPARAPSRAPWPRRSPRR